MKKKFKINYGLLILVTLYAVVVAAILSAGSIIWYLYHDSGRLVIKALKDGRYLFQNGTTISEDPSYLVIGLSILMIIIHIWINHNKNGKTGQEFFASLPVARRDEMIKYISDHVIYGGYACLLLSVLLEIGEIIAWKRMQALLPQFAIDFSGVTHFKEAGMAFVMLLVFTAVVLLCETVTAEKNTGLFLGVFLAAYLLDIVLLPLGRMLANSSLINAVLCLAASAAIFALTVYLHEKAEYSKGGVFRFGFARDIFLAIFSGTWMYASYFVFWTVGGNMRLYGILVDFLGILIACGIYYLTTAKGRRKKAKEIGICILRTLVILPFVQLTLFGMFNIQSETVDTDAMTYSEELAISQTEDPEAENRQVLMRVEQELFGALDEDEIVFADCRDRLLPAAKPHVVAWRIGSAYVGGSVFVRSFSEEWEVNGYYMVVTPPSPEYAQDPNVVTEITIPIAVEGKEDQYKEVWIIYKGNMDKLKERLKKED